METHAAPNCGGRHKGFGNGGYWSYGSKRMAFSEMGWPDIFKAAGAVEVEASCAYTSCIQI